MNEHIRVLRRSSPQLASLRKLLNSEMDDFKSEKDQSRHWIDTRGGLKYIGGSVIYGNLNGRKRGVVFITFRHCTERLASATSLYSAVQMVRIIRKIKYHSD